MENFKQLIGNVPWLAILFAFFALFVIDYFEAPAQKLAGRKLSSFDWEGATRFMSDEEKAEYFKAQKELQNAKGKAHSAIFDRINEFEKPYRDYERKFIADSALSRSEVKSFIEKYSRLIGESPVQELKRRFGLPYAWGAKRYIRETNNDDPDFFYPVQLDDEFFASCSQYAFFVMRGEDPGTFIDPLGSVEPIGTILAQGYRPIPVDEVAEDDLVVYLTYDPDAPNGEEEREEIIHGKKVRVRSSRYVVECSHFGVVRSGKVTSKDLWGYTAHHSFDGGGMPGWRYLVFRKPLNPEHGVPVLDGFSDWYDTELCVTREKYAYPVRIRRLRPASFLAAFLGASVGMLLTRYLRR